MKTMIAMSGGVDSGVAAFLLKQQGCFATGVMLRLRLGTENDEADAQDVANRLGIPFMVVDAKDDFDRYVVETFVRTYEQCGTPNPCIACNRYLKFGKLYELAMAQGMDRFATGHYARIEVGEDGQYRLLKAKDTAKDQSYVLYGLTQDMLAHLDFPLGRLTKEEIRAIAKAQGFVNQDKPDSQDICFIPDGDYASFIERVTGHCSSAGNFVSPDGQVLGRHKGLIHYTIGQRKGLGIASEAPLFVVELRPETNEVVLSHGEGLFAKTVLARDLNFIRIAPPATPIRVSAKLRYAMKEQPATAVMDGNDLRVTFDDAQRAPTPGQSVVLYDGEEVLGGGILSTVLKE